MRVLLALLLIASASASANYNADFWQKAHPSKPEDQHSVVFSVAMAPKAAANCDSLLMEISTPGPKRGNFLSFNEVGNMFRNRHAEKKALRWLRTNGIKKSEMRMTPHGEFIRVTTAVAKLEKLLGAKFHAYSAVEDPKHKVHRALDFELPLEIRPFITFVSDTNILPVPPSMARRAFRTSKMLADGNVSPSLLNSFYKIDNNTVADPRSTLSLFESLGQDFSPSDLTAFQQNFGLPNQAVDHVIGPNDPSQCTPNNPNACGEANLDVQWALAIANNANMTYWSVPGNGDIFLQWIEAVAADANPPLIHSLSYGSLAPEDPKFDVENFNTQMCKLGLKGLTLVVATGDDGVANFEARNNPSACGFTPSFPATSPYCLAVGATQGPETDSNEIVCASNTGGLITSGGGFSTYVKRPSWQDDAVKQYLSSGMKGPLAPPTSAFASDGRAYPDVAMLGHNYQVTIGGNIFVESGTSASAPVVAGMLTLINGQRLSKGKSPMGFVTPMMYQLGANGDSIFNDITVGTNQCCAAQSNPVCCQYGFNAAPGWDPTTGWGTINFDKALQHLGSM